LPSQTLVIRLDAGSDPAPAVVDRLDAFAEAAALSPRTAHRLTVVCEELATNVAMHGAAGPDGATYIEITVDRFPAHLAVTVEDDGRPFDPLGLAAPDTGLSLEEREIGGLGIHLVRNLVRSIAYERRAGCNRLSAVLDAEG
jgi:serine/threonine-protein kinase RsbW